MCRRMIIPLVLCLATATAVQAQGHGVGTPVEAKRMVEQAVAYIKAYGEAMAL